MPLHRMDLLLKNAQTQKIALGAFESWESLNIRGVAEASARCGVPVIFQASPAEYSLPEVLTPLLT